MPSRLRSRLGTFGAALRASCGSESDRRRRPLAKSMRSFGLGRDIRLLFGPLAAVIFAVSIIRLAMMVPGYSGVRQTVSEIGEVGSPARIPFAIMLWCVAAAVAIFSLALRKASLEASGAPRACTDVATSFGRQGAGRFFGDHGRARLVRHRHEPQHLGPERADLGVHPADLWAGPKRALRHMVRVVRRDWTDAVAEGGLRPRPGHGDAGARLPRKTPFPRACPGAYSCLMREAEAPKPRKPQGPPRAPP